MEDPTGPAVIGRAHDIAMWWHWIISSLAATRLREAADEERSALSTFRCLVNAEICGCCDVSASAPNGHQLGDRHCAHRRTVRFGCKLSIGCAPRTSCRA